MIVKSLLALCKCGHIICKHLHIHIIVFQPSTRWVNSISVNFGRPPKVLIELETLKKVELGHSEKTMSCLGNGLHMFRIKYRIIG